MAAFRVELAAPPLTYEDYLVEGEVFERSDIVDGVRVPMTNLTRRYQGYLFRIARILEEFSTAAGVGEMIIAPVDVLISKAPLRTRQPDVLLISHSRLFGRCLSG